mmetsp:Transcript_40935/g.41809  ORF Transcript_40935/g.41809 Transcript_40935/m.41809 type:complete len:82 (-) Transcript_40935:83-328(-)
MNRRVERLLCVVRSPLLVMTCGDRYSSYRNTSSTCFLSSRTDSAVTTISGQQVLVHRKSEICGVSCLVCVGENSVLSVSQL